MARTYSKDQELRARAEAVIPGGMYGHQSTALLPDDYPQFFERGDIRDIVLGHVRNRGPGGAQVFSNLATDRAHRLTLDRAPPSEVG